MTDKVLDSYKEHLYSKDTNTHLLECASGSTGCEPKRLSERYFDKTKYDKDNDFGVTDDLRDELMNEVVANDQEFPGMSEIGDWFTTRIKNACQSQLTLQTGVTQHPALPSTGLRELSESTNLSTDLSDDFKSSYATPTDFSVLLPYFVWKYIDEMYPVEERRDYFLIERMHLLTKLVFILHILNPSYFQTTDADSLVPILDKIMTFLVKQSLIYTSIGDPTTDISLDDASSQNVALSHKVRENSDNLIEKKGIVQKTQDNLRSLVNVDKHVQSTRKVAWYVMVVLVILLAISVAGMAYAYARGRTGEVYMVASFLVLGVVAFEAFKGAERLFALPTSVFE